MECSSMKPFHVWLLQACSMAILGFGGVVAKKKKKKIIIIKRDWSLWHTVPDCSLPFMPRKRHTKVSWNDQHQARRAPSFPNHRRRDGPLPPGH